MKSIESLVILLYPFMTMPLLLATYWVHYLRI